MMSSMAGFRSSKIERMNSCTRWGWEPPCPPPCLNERWVFSLLGEKEEAEEKVAVRSRFLGDEGQKSLQDFIEDICKEIRTKEIRKIEVQNDK